LRSFWNLCPKNAIDLPLKGKEYNVATFPLRVRGKMAKGAVEDTIGGQLLRKLQVRKLKNV